MPIPLSERTPTGIDGLDPLIEGGLLKGDIVLLAGGTGTGKTIFSAQFIYKGAALYGEKGVYATFEEDVKTLRRNMLRFGFDLEKLEREGKVRIVDLESLRGEGLSTNIEFILSTLDQIGGERLVIDSLTAFLTASPDKFEYRTLMHLLYRMLKTRGCTTIMTCSVPIGAKALGFGVEEFLVDSVMALETVTEGMELKTKFSIRKMRGTEHSRKYHNVVITKKGLKIVPFTVT